jgi:short-subunit dehydrogenase
MNKTALITGTSRGLGQQLAESLLDNNWNVIGLSRSCSIYHTNYTHYTVDISNVTQLAQTFENLKDVKLDLLVNNSAIFSNSLFKDTDRTTITNIINTNVTGTIMVTHNCLNLLLDGSKIIFVNSVAGLNDLLGQSIYCASKHAIKSFAGVLAQELRSRKIRISNIHPGGMNTTLWDSNYNPYPPGDVKDAMSVESIVDVLKMIIDCDNNIDFKTVTMFPLIEWH